jgi:4-hydroxythreonine-4-phosphate dehydrogenase
MGDPAGIGAEISLAAWASGQVAQPFFLIGDPAHLAPQAARAGVPLAEIAGPGACAAAFAGALPVLPLALPAPAVPGKPCGTAPASPFPAIPNIWLIWLA